MRLLLTNSNPMGHIRMTPNSTQRCCFKVTHQNAGRIYITISEPTITVVFNHPEALTSMTMNMCQLKLRNKMLTPKKKIVFCKTPPPHENWQQELKCYARLKSESLHTCQFDAGVVKPYFSHELSQGEQQPGTSGLIWTEGWQANCNHCLSITVPELQNT